MSELASMHEGPMVLLPELVLLPSGPVAGYGVLVENGTIIEVAPAAAFADRQLPRADLPGRLLMPGFIDAHHHLTQAFGKSLVFGEPSEIFRRVWVPMERHLDAEAMAVATRLAGWEAMRGGFTTVADAGTRASVDTATIAGVTSAIGLRCVLGVICNDLTDGKRSIETGEVLGMARDHLARFDASDLVHPSLAISIPEAASDDTLAGVATLARKAGVPFQTHVNEHLTAIERSLVTTGLRPLERLAAVGALGTELLAAHATMMTPHEINLLRESGGAISYNPVASSWKGNAVAQALLLHELGVRVGLGTDGTRGDAFRLLDAAETAQRLAHGMPIGDSSSGGGWTWLEEGLIGSADAVGLGGKVGQITPGAYADLLVIDLEVPELVPSWDLMWELVRLAGRDQIESVIVHGRLRLHRGRPVDWDGQAFLQEARKVARRVVDASPVQRIDPFATTHRSRRIEGSR